MIELDIKTCQKCYHPCHCGEDNDLHADEYGVCKREDRDWETPVNKFLPKIFNFLYNFFYHDLPPIILFFSVTKYLCSLYTKNASHDKNPQICEP